MGNSVTFSSDIHGKSTHMNANHRRVPALLAHILKTLVIVMAGFIAYQSLAPTNAAGSLNHMDKFLHAAVYCVLAFLMAGGWWRSTLLIIFLVTAAFGAVLEMGQGLMGLGRTASLGDQFANMGGAALGCGVWIVIVILYRNKRVDT